MIDSDSTSKSKRLTIQQAAVASGYDYKTIYRLVLSGELKAEQCDGVWLIQDQALQDHTRVTRQADLSPSVTTYATSTTKMICGYCFRNVSPSAGNVKICSHFDCDIPICSTCSQRGIRFCSKHSTENVHDPESDVGVHKGIPRSVSLAQASQRELTLVGRFEDCIFSTSKLRHPLTNELLVINDWRPWHTRHGNTLLHLWNDARPSRIYDAFPLPTHDYESRFALSRGCIARDSPQYGLIIKLVCVAAFRSDRNSVHEARALSIVEILQLIHALQTEAEMSESCILYGLVPLTGCDSDGIEFIESKNSQQAMRHRLSLPLIIDAETGRLHYNKKDERFRTLIHLFQGVGGIEESSLEDWIKSTIEDSHRTGVTLREVVDTLTSDPQAVENAFLRLARTYQYEIRMDTKGETILLRMRKQGEK